MSLEVLREDNHCLVVNKPAGLLSQGDETGDESVVSLARSYLKERYGKAGNVFVGLVHRLDRPTSGVVVLAKTSKGASRLSEQFRAGSIRKIYWAIVEGRPEEETGIWVDRLEKDRSANRVRVVGVDDEEEEASGQEARVAYQWIQTIRGCSLLELTPHTGRGHQLRVQLSSRKMPILGDRKYGSRVAVPAADGGSRIALHAREIAFNHPTTREEISAVAPLPTDWPWAS